MPESGPMHLAVSGFGLDERLDIPDAHATFTARGDILAVWRPGHAAGPADPVALGKVLAGGNVHDPQILVILSDGHHLAVGGNSELGRRQDDVLERDRLRDLPG